MHRSQRNFGCRIHDEYTYKNMNVVVLENEKLRISILPDKGTDIFEFLYKPKDLDITWLSPNGVQYPNDYLSTSPDPQSIFLDYYPGGWQEIFPNGGPSSESLGALFGQHGEVTQMKWDYTIISDSSKEVCVEFSVRCKKTPFFIRKRLSLQSESSTLFVQEWAENLSNVEIPVMWGQHLAFGFPFLEQDSYIQLPENVRVIPHADAICDIGRRVQGDKIYDWPHAVTPTGDDLDLRFLPQKGAPSEMLYLQGDTLDHYTIVSPNHGVSVSVEWDPKLFPYLWFWQEFGGSHGYPSYGRYYTIGLEPFSSMPTNGLKEAIQNGTALKFQSQETKHHHFSVGVLEI